jgi:hypothetical protein
MGHSAGRGPSHAHRNMARSLAQVGPPSPFKVSFSVSPVQPGRLVYCAPKPRRQAVRQIFKCVVKVIEIPKVESRRTNRPRDERRDAAGRWLAEVGGLVRYRAANAKVAWSANAIRRTNYDRHCEAVILGACATSRLRYSGFMMRASRSAIRNQAGPSIFGFDLRPAPLTIVNGGISIPVCSFISIVPNLPKRAFRTTGIRFTGLL